MRAPAWTLAAALVAGCADDAPVADDAAVDAALADAAVDASDDAVDAPTDDGLWAGALRLPFHYTGVSEPVGGYERAELTDNLGTVTIEGDARPTLAAQTVDWTSAGYRLVHLYTTSADDLHITFVYCRDGQTAGSYVESLTALTVFYDDVTPHPCAVTTGDHVVAARLRPITALPEGFEPLRRATVAGPGLTLDAQGLGRITLADLDWDLTPFAWVDCPAATCGQGGWYEVHALLRRPGGATGSVILYLMRDDPMHVRTSYGLRLDAPEHLPNTMFAAPWSLLR